MDCINCGEKNAKNNARDVSNWNLEEYKDNKLCDECFEWEKRIDNYEQYMCNNMGNDRDLIATILALQDEIKCLKNQIKEYFV